MGSTPAGNEGLGLKAGKLLQIGYPRHLSGFGKAGTLAGNSCLATKRFKSQLGKAGQSSGSIPAGTYKGLGHDTRSNSSATCVCLLSVSCDRLVFGSFSRPLHWQS